MGPKLERTFFLRGISLDEVIDEINGIFEKIGMDYDNIPPKVIKFRRRQNKNQKNLANG